MIYPVIKKRKSTFVNMRMKSERKFIERTNTNPRHVHRLNAEATSDINNLFETLPIFIGLVLLSIIDGVDNSLLAMIWLLARIIYVPVYIVGINYLRTGIWAIALICLIIMSVNFL